MIKNNLLPLLVVLLLSTGSAVQAAEIGIAATVQGQEISEARLQTAIDSYLLQQGTNVGAIRDPRRYKELREKVLEVLIGQELLWQAASRDKIYADDAEVEQAFDQYRAQFEDDLSFDNKLQQGGFNRARFQQNLKQQLSVQKWIQESVPDQVELSLQNRVLKTLSRFAGSPLQTRTDLVRLTLRLQAEAAETPTSSTSSTPSV